MKKIKSYPFHPIFFSISPILALFATNIAEVEYGVIIRPLLIVIIGTIFLMGLLHLVLKDIYKAAVLTSLLLILFFTYGHVYQILELKQVFGLNIGRHRYLVLFYLIVGVLGTWIILRKIKNVHYTTQLLNIMGLLMLVFPVVQILNFTIRISSGETAVIQLDETSANTVLHPPEKLPDIYYIVLDTYTRADALKQDFHFDNGPFLDELRELGFYVADCSRSNYSYTQASIVAALNMDYLPELKDDLSQLGLGMEDIWVLLKQSLVRRNLEEIGYQTVAFETGYEWSQIRDADYYYGVGTNPFRINVVTPFESLLLKSTAIHFLTDSQSWFFKQHFEGLIFPYGEFIQRQLFILDRLIELPAIEYPKFVFVHLLIPHVPYVFDPDGKIREDPGYFGGNLAAPLNESYLVDGYTGEIQFINSRMLEIVKQIIQNSQVRPIIIIHGDHGLRDENRLQILNVYYLPDEGASVLYSSISPVNSFRVVFDTYFGTNYGLLEDESFLGDEFQNPIPEYSPECQPVSNDPS